MRAIALGLSISMALMVSACATGSADSDKTASASTTSEATTTAGAAQAAPATSPDSVSTEPVAAEPAQTTPPADAAPAAEPSTPTLRAATTTDIKAGADVMDQQGGMVGKVDSVDSAGVLINTGSVRAKVPLTSLGVGDKGLVISVTKADLEAQAKKAQ